MSEPTAVRSSLQLYRRLLSHVRPYRPVFLLAILGMVLTSTTDTAFAALLRPLIDGGFVQRDPASIRFVPLLLVGVFLVRGVASFVADYSMSWVGRKIIFDVRNSMFARLLHLPSAFYDQHTSGGLISKLIYDVEQVASAATKAFTSMVQDSLVIVGLLTWMFYLNWKLTLLLLLLGPAVALLVRNMSQRFRRTSRMIQESMGDITHAGQEAIEGQRVIKTFCAQPQEIEAFAKVNNRNRQQTMKKTAIAAAGVPLIQLIGAATLAWVVYLAMQQPKTTVGTFISYIGAMMLLLGPLRRLTQVNEIVQTGLAAAQSVFTLIDEAPEADEGKTTLASVKGLVEYRQVGFHYPRARTPALSEVSFRIEPGKTLALVGPSGGGKTTIANLLPRFYTVQEGEILLDQVNINALTLENLRGHISLVSQETVLFNDTVRNNICFGQRGPVSEARVLDAAVAAHLMEFVERMPQGLDTFIGEKGMRLSGGQRQRLAIARALLKNAPILVLDEATASLDTESEKHVQAAMEKLMENRTTLVIAHRLSTIERAHRIVVLVQGRVVESGTHQDLLALNRVYARLYRMQFSEQPL